MHLTGRPAQSDTEHLIARAITTLNQEHGATRDAVVRHLVASWLAHDFRNAWAVDVGIW